MDTRPISSATAMDLNPSTTSIPAGETSEASLSDSSSVEGGSSTMSTDPSSSPSPAAPTPASSADASVPITESGPTTQGAFPTVDSTYTSPQPAPVPTTMILVTSIGSSRSVTMSTSMTVPKSTTTLPVAARPSTTASSKQHVPYEKQHEKQIIGGALGGAAAVLLVMGLLLWLFLHLRRKWMSCKKRCQIRRLRPTDSNDSKRSGDGDGAECCLKFIPKKVRFRGICSPSCCRPGIAEGDEFIQELETHDPTGAPRISHLPHRRPARYVSFFGHSGNRDFQTPTTWPETAIKAQESRYEKKGSRRRRLKVSNPDPNAAIPSNEGSSASEDAAAAPGFVAGPEYDAQDPDAIIPLSKEASADTTSFHSLDSNWATKLSEFTPSPPKRKSLSPLKPTLPSKSNSRPKPKKSILKKLPKDGPSHPVESMSGTKEYGEASYASSSGEGPSKAPKDQLKFSFEDLTSGESRLGFPQAGPPTAEIGMLKLKDLTSPQREGSPIPNWTFKGLPDPTQTLKDSIDHRAQVGKRNSAVRGSADSKGAMSEDCEGSEAGQDRTADRQDRTESAIRSEARGDGVGDTESETGHQQDSTEIPSSVEQEGTPSQTIEVEAKGQEGEPTPGGD